MQIMQISMLGVFDSTSFIRYFCAMTAPGASLELRSSPFRQMEVRLVRNNWVTDIYGSELGFGDLGVLDMAHLESQVEPLGALLLIEERSGASLNYGRGLTRNHVATDEQLEVVDELSALEPNENHIPSSLNERAKHELPALYLARIGIVQGGILFRGGPREMYLGLMRHIEEGSQFTTAEDKALYLRAKSLGAVSLPTPAFILEVAKHAKSAQ
ncbi:MAG TPA: hypothetical protein VH234_01090 [Candidatus Saccharimonadales bacterium]|jgi:hypothetical protein|nr:hypothetical protein [Candidatus Saccharimonadales bacterium]